MGSNRFYLTVFIYCFLIFLAAFLFFYFLVVKQQYSSAAGIALLALLLLARLVYSVNRTNRMLGTFLTYLQEDDPSLHYSRRFVERHFRGLQDKLSSLLLEFREQRIELEIQARYLEAILNHVSTGILCYDEQGRIRTMNQSARLYLGGELGDLSDLRKTQPDLLSDLLQLEPGQECTRILREGNKSLQLLIHKSWIRLKQESIQILAIHDISYQMEEQEIQSWKKLIRVINHEIMNSMTPIITLSMAIRKKLGTGTDPKSGKAIKPEGISDALESADIIRERSAGLVHFIERYKQLTSLPPLKPEALSIARLFESIKQLYRDQLEEQSVRLFLEQEGDLCIKADREMMEQVLINLVKNALEALSGRADARIELRSYQNDLQEICIEVMDNGEGISPEKLDQVFVPFFSTREKGTGIGLSLCHQIMRLHQGQIDMESSPGKGSSVYLRFPA